MNQPSTFAYQPSSRAAGSAAVIGKTIQQYIDETPLWSDGTPAPRPPMTPMQWWIWSLATAGKFFEGLVVFLTGVALPLIVQEFGVGAFEKGLLSAATVFGILVGATALGHLTDRIGRKQMFIAEMALFTVCLVLVSLAPNLAILVTALFGMGLALGCDYPTGHMVLSESIPSVVRGRLVLSAFGFQAVGALTATALGYGILRERQSIGDWRLMFASAILPATLVTIGRFFIPQSSHWLASTGRTKEAEAAVQQLLRREPPYPREIRLATAGESDRAMSWWALCKRLFQGRYRRATILAAVPWFLQDLSTYGIGIFTPTILAVAIGGTIGAPRNLADMIHNDMLAAKGAALIDAFLILGIVAAVVLVDRVGRIRLQVTGFIGCAIGLLVAASAARFDQPVRIALIFAGFMLFNFMSNLGPNAMTYLIAGEVFPTRMRGLGAGFAASFAKIGAVLTAFLFPILLHQMGTARLLVALVATCVLGAVVTARFAIETKGLNLETLSLDD